MGFWPFGGGKRKRSSKLVEAGDMAQEKLEQASKANERQRDLEKLSSSNNGQPVTEKTTRNSRMGMSTQRDVPYTPPRGTYAASETAATSSRQIPTAPSGPMSKRETTSNSIQPNPKKYLYYQTSRSHSSIGPENFTVTMTPPTLRARRSEQETLSPRQKSSKRKAEDHAREREVRAMSSPIPIPKRSSAQSTGPMRKETKKIPGDLNRHLERPVSEVSLPLPESFSELNDIPHQNSFKINAFAILSPRPTIRYDGNPRYNPPRSQTQSRTSARQMITEEEDFSNTKRIDNLADSLDSGGLRELMERDRRRRERKRETDKAKLHRKLQRRAERQNDEEQDARGEGSRPYTPKGKNVIRDTDMEITPKSALDGLGIHNGELNLSSSPIPPDAMEEDQESHRDNPFADVHRFESDEPRQSQNVEPISDPFAHAEDDEPELPPPPPPPVARGVLREDQTSQKDLSDPVLPERSPLRAMSREMLVEPTSLSPPTSPAPIPVDRSSTSQTSALATERASDSRGSVDTSRRASDQSSAPINSWATFFRRGGRRKQSSADQGRDGTSEFSNTSRESFSRQQPPPVVPPRSFKRDSSGAPQRTRSKFREDLPEIPISPPDSRIQSPEADLPSQTSQSLFGAADGKSLATSSSVPTLDRSRQEDQISQPQSMDLASSERPPSAAMVSQSLASVDSEGSWLSGKPVKRSSAQMGHPLRQSQGSLQKEISAAGSEEREETDVAHDEYFHRLTPAPEETRRSSSSSAIRKASSGVINLEEVERGADVEVPPIPDRAGEMWQGTVERHPTVIHQPSRAKSKEGLMKDNEAEDQDISSGDEESDTAELSTAQEELHGTPILRAKSVEYGKGHARHISAGSAKLLDIRRSSIQSEGLLGADKGPTGS